jgi:hypothetical protein
VYHGYGGKALVRYCIDEFAGLVHPRDGHPKIFAMIDAYLDESGIHDGAPICVIAGYFGGSGQWRKFEQDWRDLLEGAEVPLEEFHAKDLIKRRGFFLKWGNDKHAQFLNGIAETICRYKIYPVSQSLILKDFNALSLGEKKFFTGARIDHDGKLLTSGCSGKPYFMPFQYCLRHVCSYAPVGGKAHFFFGLDRSFYEYATDLFKFLKEHVDMPNKERLGDISAPMAKLTPQLQAADYHSYLTYLHGQERIQTGNWMSPPPMDPLNAIVQRVRHKDDCIFFDTHCLRGMLKKQLPESAQDALSRQ